MKKNVKTLYMIAGANGSGKTTFASHYQSQFKIPFVNADEISKELSPTDLNKVKLKAGKEFFKQVFYYLSSNQTFMIESTLSGRYLNKIITKAKTN